MVVLKFIVAIPAAILIALIAFILFVISVVSAIVAGLVFGFDID